MQAFIPVDGSYGEGGGQILRTSLSLSVLTGQPVEITHIRAGRSKPGLQPQHLAAVRAAAQICAANMEDDAVGSTRLFFAPQAPAAPGQYRFAIGTAGAVPLVMQTVLLPLALANAPSQVTVIGGTHVPHAPTTNYLSDFYGALLERQGVSIRFHSPSAGFNPKGGGALQAEIEPVSTLQPIDLVERGSLESLTSHIITAHLPVDVSKRGEAAVLRRLSAFSKDRVVVQRDEVSSLGPGAAIVLIARTENSIAGFSAIGARGRPMEAVADKACDEFLAWWNSGAACDEHGADQLVLPMSLVPQESRWTTPRVTDHLRTVLWTVQQFLPIDASLQERADGSALVTLRGVSLP